MRQSSGAATPAVTLIGNRAATYLRRGLSCSPSPSESRKGRPAVKRWARFPIRALRVQPCWALQPDRIAL